MQTSEVFARAIRSAKLKTAEVSRASEKGEDVEMSYTINEDYLARARTVLSGRDHVYWLVGGAGAGKTTICGALSSVYGMPIYDMDAQVYGAYHGRFTPQRHPVNSAWSTSANGLAWLLAMSWEQFDNFNRAALAEYLDLLAEDVQTGAAGGGLLIDGGICNPAIIAQVMPARQIVCLAAAERPSREIWEADAERLLMKEAVLELAGGQEAWRRFLEFDGRITRTIIAESIENDIPICRRGEGEEVAVFAQQIAGQLGLSKT